jgi:hypothetical protein
MAAFLLLTLVPVWITPGFTREQTGWNSSDFVQIDAGRANPRSYAAIIEGKTFPAYKKAAETAFGGS